MNNCLLVLNNIIYFHAYIFRITIFPAIFVVPFCQVIPLQIFLFGMCILKLYFVVKISMSCRLKENFVDFMTFFLFIVYILSISFPKMNRRRYFVNAKSNCDLIESIFWFCWKCWLTLWIVYRFLNNLIELMNDFLFENDGHSTLILDLICNFGWKRFFFFKYWE